MVVALRVSNLTKEFGDKLALDNVSFDVHKGEIFGVIGMSGSGKTTLLNHLIGFLQPNEGEIAYRPGYIIKEGDGELKNLHKHISEVKQIFGFSPQMPSFYPRLTVYENLLHFGSLYHLESKAMKQNIAHLLALTKLEQHKDKLAEHLSGGQQRRLSIICGVIHKPEVLILDEPTADLDPVLREEAWNLITAINKLGTTIIIASHFLDELETYCGRVLIIHNGKVMKYGKVADITRDFAHDTVEIIVETEPANYHKLLSGLSKQNIVGVHQGERRITIHTSKPKETLYELARVLKSENISSGEVNVRRATLSEVFERIALGRESK